MVPPCRTLVQLDFVSQIGIFPSILTTTAPCGSHLGRGNNLRLVASFHPDSGPDGEGHPSPCALTPDLSGLTSTDPCFHPSSPHFLQCVTAPSEFLIWILWTEYTWICECPKIEYITVCACVCLCVLGGGALAFTEFFKRIYGPQISDLWGLNVFLPFPVSPSYPGEQLPRTAQMSPTFLLDVPFSVSPGLFLPSAFPAGISLLVYMPVPLLDPEPLGLRAVPLCPTSGAVWRVVRS